MYDKNKQTGAGTLGFLLVSFPIIFTALTAVEIIYWLNMRQAINLTLVQAARSGITSQANPEIIASSFESYLNYPFPNKSAITKILQQQRKALGLAWQITIISPSPKSFADHKSHLVASNSLGKDTINNFYQQQQHDNNISKGWNKGKGPDSDTDIYEANTLIMELVWPHKPLLPFTGKIVKSLAPTNKTNQYIMQNGYLPIRLSIKQAMQSNPMIWPELADGRVIYEYSPSLYENNGKPFVTCIPTGMNNCDANINTGGISNTHPEKEGIYNAASQSNTPEDYNNSQEMHQGNGDIINPKAGNSKAETTEDFLTDCNIGY